MQCEICHLEESKYKCPKCNIRYCSLKCFKNDDLHVHDSTSMKDETATSGDIENTIETPGKAGTKDFSSSKYYGVYNDSPELKELLRYNTVKFHLAKVHRILTTNIHDPGDSSFQLDTESKRQLAVDYLNTLRFGGIHYNEAIEEFCQIALQKLENV